jgi:hypothetical protein
MVINVHTKRGRLAIKSRLEPRVKETRHQDQEKASLTPRSKLADNAFESEERMELSPESASTKPIRKIIKRPKKRPIGATHATRKAGRNSSPVHESRKDETEAKTLAGLQSLVSPTASTTPHANNSTEQNNESVNQGVSDSMEGYDRILQIMYPFLNIYQLAKRWHCSDKTLRNKISSKTLKLRYYKDQGKLLFHIDDIIAYEKQHSIGHAIAC